MNEFEAFAQKHGITMQFVRVPENPHADISFGNANHWFITLSRKNAGVFTLYLSKGTGLVEMYSSKYRSVDPDTGRKRSHGWGPCSPTEWLHKNWYSLKNKQDMEDLIGGRLSRKGTNAGVDLDSPVRKFRWAVPSLDEVLLCIQQDSRDILYSHAFEDWAESLGFDTDSRSAERTYNAVREQTYLFKKFLPANAWDEFSSLEEE